jgi:hypothetical protein
MTKPGKSRQLLLYVRKEPGLSGPQWESLGSTGMRVVSGFVPGVVLKARPPGSMTPAADESGLEIPYEQMHCVKLVMDMSKKLNYTVTIVDVGRTGAAPGPRDRGRPPVETYPILERPDGAQLAGPEYFTPSRLRKFLSS